MRESLGSSKIASPRAVSGSCPRQTLFVEDQAPTVLCQGNLLLRKVESGTAALSSHDTSRTKSITDNKNWLMFSLELFNLWLSPGVGWRMTAFNPFPICYFPWVELCERKTGGERGGGGD